MKRFTAGGFLTALAAGGAWLAFAVGLAAAEGARPYNGLVPPPQRAGLGSLEVVPNGCEVAYTVNVVTASGGGQDTFELQVADDGQLIHVESLSAPADGASHQIVGAFRLPRPPSQVTPGIGIFLVDNGAILDAVDPLGVPCSIVEVPALAGKGYLALGGVLALAALVSIRRPRQRA